jgi:hypothetical protein
MNADPEDTETDDTPEYPLPSPTDSLSRDQRPPDDDAAEDQLRESSASALTIRPNAYRNSFAVECHL